MTILFLDLDGVLHPVGGGVVPLEYAPILEAALEPYPAVHIVLSSSWVEVFGFDDTRAMLPPALQKRVVGSTYDPAYKHQQWWLTASRYEAIAHYVERYCVKSWLAIDDDDDGWPAELRHKLVCPPKHVGLAAAGMQAELAYKLRSLAP